MMITKIMINSLKECRIKCTLVGNIGMNHDAYDMVHTENKVY